MKCALFIFLVILANLDIHENVCSHTSVSTYNNVRVVSYEFCVCQCTISQRLSSLHSLTPSRAPQRLIGHCIHTVVTGNIHLFHKFPVPGGSYAHIHILSDYVTQSASYSSSNLLLVWLLCLLELQYSKGLPNFSACNI